MNPPDVTHQTAAIAPANALIAALRYLSQAQVQPPTELSSPMHGGVPLTSPRRVRSSTNPATVNEPLQSQVASEPSAQLGSNAFSADTQWNNLVATLTTMIQAQHATQQQQPILPQSVQPLQASSTPQLPPPPSAQSCPPRTATVGTVPDDEAHLASALRACNVEGITTRQALQRLDGVRSTLPFVQYDDSSLRSVGRSTVIVFQVSFVQAPFKKQLRAGHYTDAVHYA